MDQHGAHEGVTWGVNRFRPLFRGKVPVVFLVFCFIAVLARAQDAKAPSEYQLKAAYLYHFAQFAEWPAGTFSSDTAPFTIGVLGQNPFGSALEDAVQGKRLNNHPLVVKELHSPAEATNQCQLLFVCSSEKKRLSDIFATLHRTSVLTVGESDQFLESGGMIKFLQEGTKIHFQINETAARQAGLRLSSKLLSLASRPSN